MASTIVSIAWGYTIIGAVTAAVFLSFGVGRVSPDARGAFVFRLLLIPGTVLLWPLVLLRWWQLERGSTWGAAQHRPPRAVQNGAALVLSLAIPVILFGLLVARQDGPLEAAPVPLDAPAQDASTQ